MISRPNVPAGQRQKENGITIRSQTSRYGCLNNNDKNEASILTAEIGREYGTFEPAVTDHPSNRFLL